MVMSFCEEKCLGLKVLGEAGPNDSLSEEEASNPALGASRIASAPAGFAAERELDDPPCRIPSIQRRRGRSTVRDDTNEARQTPAFADRNALTLGPGKPLECFR